MLKHYEVTSENYNAMPSQCYNVISSECYMSDANTHNNNNDDDDREDCLVQCCANDATQISSNKQRLLVSDASSVFSLPLSSTWLPLTSLCISLVLEAMVS